MVVNIDPMRRGAGSLRSYLVLIDKSTGPSGSESSQKLPSRRGTGPKWASYFLWRLHKGTSHFSASGNGDGFANFSTFYSAISRQHCNHRHPGTDCLHLCSSIFRRMILEL